MAASITYRDPKYDGAADPTVIFNRDEQEWWMLYTARRANVPGLEGVRWVHGTDIGIASSADHGATWKYRGTAQGLDTEPGRNTFWAPEIVDDGVRYHMYVSYIRGEPSTWAGHERRIRHYTSDDLVHWVFAATLDLSSDFVIDACVLARPAGGWRMWYKDEADGSTTWYADSDDLFQWRLGGRAVGGAPHEGPNVFQLGASWWMVTDEWKGLRAWRSDDLIHWERHSLILDRPGSRTDDAGVGHHADVVPVGDAEAVIFYFTHLAERHDGRVTVVHAATARIRAGELVCDRDELPQHLPQPAGYCPVSP